MFPYFKLMVPPVSKATEAAHIICLCLAAHLVDGPGAGKDGVVGGGARAHAPGPALESLTVPPVIHREHLREDLARALHPHRELVRQHRPVPVLPWREVPAPEVAPEAAPDAPATDAAEGHTCIHFRFWVLLVGDMQYIDGIPWHARIQSVSHLRRVPGWAAVASCRLGRRLGRALPCAPCSRRHLNNQIVVRGC